MTNRDEARERLAVRLAEIGGCSDGNCVVVKPTGMHTNGGCKCLRNPLTAQRVVYAYKVAVEALLADQPLPVEMGKGDAEQGWQGIESAPNNRPFWARKSNNEIALCWRHNPSSRTDEVMTWKGNQGFKAVEWRAPDPLPSTSSKGGE